MQAGSARPFLERGWLALQHDSDNQAMDYFWRAYEAASGENNTEETAEALLNMGITSYGASLSEGLHYCFRSMDEYKKLEKKDPGKALVGRSKCLQLISTIYSRQGRYRESIQWSREAMAGFTNTRDTNGYIGLIYNSLGIAYKNLEMPDSSAYYHHLALQERLRTRKYIYLPVSYLNVADIELESGNKKLSEEYYQRALTIADSTGNRQAQVASLLGVGKWKLVFEKNETEAGSCFLKAQTVANTLSDKSYYLSALDALIGLRKQEGKLNQALALAEEKQALKDTLMSWERQKNENNLQIQFKVAEKDRQLSLVRKEKDIATLTNYLLWVVVAFLILAAIGVIYFLRRINRRDKQLLQTREALMVALEKQKKLEEQKMRNELEFKESELSIMAIKMLQKNQLLGELKDLAEKEKDNGSAAAVGRILNKGASQDNDWEDFNSHFESVNKNFYSRLKQAYPEISPNDLKLAALIKLNLSSKEMAGILNISPDSVKTARYRLRKKLQLNSEDNLTDFILNLE
jgi:DNA-binding CsgD family transcriptional regulator